MLLTIGSSHILHEEGRRHYWSGTGALSIKSFLRGRAYYDVGAGRYAVDDRSYLLLNHDRPYAITIDAERSVESFCIFFEKGLAEDVDRSLTTGDVMLLDDPFLPSSGIEFFERTYPHDDLVTPALALLRSSLAERKDDAAWLRERLHDILARMLRVHRGVAAEAAALPAVRASTREELYRRLLRARDYMAASLDASITLDDIARVACLSPNHLLRTFRQAFGQTPHQYLTARRLERAKDLLAQSDRSVTDIAAAVGFESLGSFSWLFRRHVGLSPEGYRRASRAKR